MIRASRSAATFDTGSGAGGRASAFRTALGICPRPVVCRYRIARHGQVNPPRDQGRYSGSLTKTDPTIIADSIYMIRLTFYAKQRQAPTVNAPLRELGLHQNHDRQICTQQGTGP